MHTLFDRFLLKFAIWFEAYLHENHRSVSKAVNDSVLDRILLNPDLDENGFARQPCCPDAAMHCKKSCNGR